MAPIAIFERPSSKLTKPPQSCIFGPCPIMAATSTGGASPAAPSEDMLPEGTLGPPSQHGASTCLDLRGLGLLLYWFSPQRCIIRFWDYQQLFQDYTGAPPRRICTQVLLIEPAFLPRALLAVLVNQSSPDGDARRRM